MSGLFLYTSNKLETLLDKLSENMRISPLHPMQPEVIIVQSKGMERYIHLEIARKNKISANILFPFPKPFVYEIFQKKYALPETSPFSPELLTWKIMKVLPGLMESKGFESVLNYVKNDDTGLKLYQLSEKIAGVFDQYLIYRPDMIMKWDKGNFSGPNVSYDEKWQSGLWQKIMEGEESNQKFHHAALKNLFLSESGFEKGLPERISVFGISTLPPYYIDIFNELSKEIEVAIYYLNPCKEYWEYAYSEKEILNFFKNGFTEDDQYFDSGNRLLASMGTMGREFFSLVLNTVGDTGASFFEDGKGDSILSCMQADILNLRERKTGNADNLEVGKGDTSFQIHSCHSPMREIEVLHNNLLSLFEEKKDLLPKDIIVMMPDVTTYAPLIQSVFDVSEGETKKIPYSIADIYLRNSNRIADTLLEILSIDNKRFRASSVLDILGVESVYRNFDFSIDDLELIMRWVKDVGINWGINGSYKEKLGLPGFHENTWEFGLDRMLLGYVLSPDEAISTFSGILPYGEIEGDDGHTLGRFIHFCEKLFKLKTSLKKPRTLMQWVDTLEDILADFFISDETTENDLKEIRNILTDRGLAGFYELSGFSGEVTIEIITHVLTKKLENTTGEKGYISTGVTFCTLLPMRSIPFKVIYILGMNENDFPRNYRKPGFDLMERQKRLCDSSKRHEDRYLFLETILSARENYFISYIGQSIKDNSELPPSSLVCELIDYIDIAWGPSISGHVITKHPLQPFSPDYFDPKYKPFSYSRQNCAAARLSFERKREEKKFVGNPLPAVSPDEWEEIDLNRLSRFFFTPAEFFLKERLYITREITDMTMPDEREPFTLSALDKYLIKKEYTDLSLKKGGCRDFYTVFKAKGKLPHGRTGVSDFLKVEKDARDFLSVVEIFLNEMPLSPVEINYSIKKPPMCLRGYLKNIYSDGQIFYRPANITVKDRLNAWIYHLALNANQKETGARKTYVLGQDRQIFYLEFDAAYARTTLENLVSHFYQGLSTPLPFSPLTSFAYASALGEKEENEVAAEANARKKWLSGYYHTGEYENPYNRMCLEKDFYTKSEFKKTAISIFEPMIEATNDIDE